MNPFNRGLEPDEERYTPPRIIAAVYKALGHIDLDPATTNLVNDTFIRAKRIYRKETDGLNRENPWKGKVFINPPGGNNKPRFFWERLIIEWDAKNVSAGIFLAFNIAQLQQTQECVSPMLRWPFCIPSKRLVFWKEKNGQLEPRESAEFPNAIVYVSNKGVKRFVDAFKEIGSVVVPNRTLSLF